MPHSRCFRLRSVHAMLGIGQDFQGHGWLAKSANCISLKKLSKGSCIDPKDQTCSNTRGQNRSDRQKDSNGIQKWFSKTLNDLTSDNMWQPETQTHSGCPSLGSTCSIWEFSSLGISGRLFLELCISYGSLQRLRANIQAISDFQMHSFSALLNTNFPDPTHSRIHQFLDGPWWAMMGLGDRRFNRFRSFTS